MTHRLERMLNPSSIACVGASPRPGSVGLGMVETLLGGGYGGEVRLVNPRHDEISGLGTHADLSSLDIVPDLVIAAVGGGRVEGVVDEAISVGAGGIVVFDGVLDDADARDRIRDKAAESGMPINGGNGMGFLNLTKNCQASFYTAEHLRPGGITLVAHSGSVFTVLSMSDPRYRFNLIVSAGQEFGATIADYVDYAVEQPETNVIALFMEAARDPEQFAASLAKARDREIPVVACKVGRTAESARLARSHTGAMAGSHAAYEALFATYGVIGVETVDELMNTAMMFDKGRFAGPGGLAVVTDSGGLRESLIDRAERKGVELATLTDTTIDRLTEVLPAALPASNPLDCAESLTDDFSEVFRRGVQIFAGAPEVAIVGYEFDGRDDYMYHEGLPDIALNLAGTTDKPNFAFSSFGQANNREFGGELAGRGVTMLNGQDQMLDTVKHLFAYRDRPEPSTAPTADPAVVEQWSERVRSGRLAERDSLAMAADFGIPIVATVGARDLVSALAALGTTGTPAVMKSDAEGLDHKTDAGAVVLDIGSVAEAEAAYAHLSDLGPAVLVQSMAGRGVELAFGCVRDPDFGPVVMVSAGGTMIELLNDRAVALAGFGEAMARHLVNSLGVRPLLGRFRGGPPADMDAVVEALVTFSAMCASLDGYTEIDLNPVIAGPDGVVAVDGLVV